MLPSAKRMKVVGRLLFEGYAEISEQATQYLTDLGYLLFDADAPPKARRPLSLATYKSLARHTSTVEARVQAGVGAGASANLR